MSHAHVSPIFQNLREPAVRGFVHAPENPTGDALILTHGAGANCQSPLLIALANALGESGVTVLRCDLPFRQSRPKGPPPRGSAERDQKGLLNAVGAMKRVSGRVFLGGHSYGGRQATMLAAEQPDLVNGLLLLSYPLHPPKKPEQLRTAHLPDLRTPALFVQGSRDSMGTHEEMQGALQLIPARTELMIVRGAGHELISAKTVQGVTETVVKAFLDFFVERG